MEDERLDHLIGFSRVVLTHKSKILRYGGIDYFTYRGEELSHYTNLNGFFGIVESNGFWLSDHRFLNDEEEFNNGRNLVIKIIKRLTTKKRFEKFKIVLDNVIIFLSNHEESPYYICSFSIKKDSLDLWKWYSSEDIGISIIFENNTSKQLYGHFCRLPHFLTPKVVYNDNIKCKILLDVIRAYYKEYRVDQENGLYQGEHILEHWHKELANRLIYEFIHFKHKEFSSESELRMIVSSRGGHFKDFEVQHRLANNKIIPYINMSNEYKDEKLPIKEIIIGPSNKQDVTKKSIEVYLKNIGYLNIPISFSKIPFRG